MPDAPILSVAALAKSYSRSGAGLKGVSLDVAEGEFFTILGPSGCGKTTLLRCIAGLEHPDAGTIAIGGEPVFDAARGLAAPPDRRRIGMVFQSYAIWPHMSVFENVAFPLRTRGGSTRGDIARRVAAGLATVGLDGLGDRPATALSGGQQQRLALARAIVDAPRLLLLDEPLSNLDTGLRERMRTELRRLQRELGITTIYVTHDQTEAMALSDRVAVMREGKVVQLGPPEEIYDRPNCRFVAGFIGSSNLLAGEVVAFDGIGRPGRIACALGTLAAVFRHEAEPGMKVWIAIRPEHLVPAEDGLHGFIRSVTFLGETTEWIVDVAGAQLVVRGSGRGARTGDAVTLTVRPDDIAVVTE